MDTESSVGAVAGVDSLASADSLAGALAGALAGRAPARRAPRISAMPTGTSRPLRTGDATAG
ncbi:MAG: hypothetical protein ACKO3S_09710, partial [bacterium]